MAISGVATVYKVHPAGGGQKHSQNPRQEQHRPHDEHEAHAATEPAAEPNAATPTHDDSSFDAPVGKRIDVSA